VDGLWLRIEMNPVIMEKILTFLYHGQVNIEYDEMETFLECARLLQIRLFKDDSIGGDPLDEADGQAGSDPHSPPPERYELNDFQLLCRTCYKVYRDDKALKKHLWACQRKPTFACDQCDKVFAFAPNSPSTTAFTRKKSPSCARIRIAQPPSTTSPV
jgi:hypothetical protein